MLSVNDDPVDHVLGYSFTDHTACSTNGAVANSGLNGNRTAYTDTHISGGVTTVTTTRYYYDKADRLLGSSTSATVNGIAATVTGLNPVADGLTALGLANSELAYDAHGNTTKLADQTLVFDKANRHLSTTVAATGGSTTISYTRDVTNRIVKRTVTVPVKN